MTWLVDPLGGGSLDNGSAISNEVRSGRSGVWGWQGDWKELEERMELVEA